MTRFKKGWSIVFSAIPNPFTEVIEDNKRVVVSNDLVLDHTGKYHIDFDDFESKIVKNHIKLFVLCSPHNPVGRVWTREELEKIADICIKYNVIVISDEIHEDFVYDGYEHTPLLNVDERIAPLCITYTSPAKTFNLAGLQISNIIIPDRNLRYALKKQIKLVEPEVTYLVWLDFRELDLCEKDLEDLIVNKARCWLDSGAIFGKVGEGFERINIATNRSVLKEALDRIARAIDQI